MVNFGGNGAEGRKNTHVFSATDHGEASTTSIRQDMGDYWGGSSAGSNMNSVRDDLHREITGNHGAVGRFATNI